MVSNLYDLDSVIIEAKEWYDKANGQSYFSARIHVNNAMIFFLPFENGNGDYYLQSAMEKMIAEKFIPSSPAEHQLSRYCAKRGILFHATICPALKRDTIAWAKW